MTCAALSFGWQTLAQDMTNTPLVLTTDESSLILITEEPIMILSTDDPAVVLTQEMQPLPTQTPAVLVTEETAATTANEKIVLSVTPYPTVPDPLIAVFSTGF